MNKPYMVNIANFFLCNAMFPYLFIFFMLVRLGFDDIAEYLREQGAFFMSRDDLYQPILGDRKVLFMGLKYVLRQVCTVFPSLQLGTFKILI